MKLEQYKQAFSKLRSDVKSYWPATTLHRAPHKPFLLLSVMDLIATDQIQANFIELNAELIDTFELYWGHTIGDERESNILMPFFHMTSERFWHLVPIQGMEQTLATIGRINSYRQFKQVLLGAKLDDDLFALLLGQDSRDDLRRILVEKYFTPEVRPEIARVGKITPESFEYSRELIDRLKGRFTLKEAPETETYLTESRSVAFRRVVVEAYQRTCAFCRVRVITPDGRTAVAASHIVPWSHGHNDDPRNGMALCGLHHWVFDQGLIGVEPDHRITVSQVVRSDGNAAQAILDLDRKTIHLPSNQMLWPAKSALRWHMDNIFWNEVPPRLL